MRRFVLCALLLVALAAAAPAAAGDGRSLYLEHCASCHGGRLEGVRPDKDRGGPALVGVGAAAVDFELRTGYMPLHDAFAQPERSDPSFDDAQIRALVAFVARAARPAIPRPNPERGSVSDGMHLFTEKCSGCHQIAGAGGVVANRVAPALTRATPVQIAEAVRLGPYVMPRFGERQLSTRQLDSIIRYVEYAKHPDDRGGWAIGHLGPVPEGMVAWLLAGAALVLVARLIGEARKA